MQRTNWATVQGAVNQKRLEVEYLASDSCVEGPVLISEAAIMNGTSVLSIFIFFNYVFIDF